VLASGSVMVDDMALHLHAVGQCAEEEVFARSLRAGASHDDRTISRCQRRLEFRCASEIGGRGIRIERDLIGAPACLCNIPSNGELSMLYERSHSAYRLWSGHRAGAWPVIRKQSPLRPFLRTAAHGAAAVLSRLRRSVRATLPAASRAKISRGNALRANPDLLRFTIGHRRECRCPSKSLSGTGVALVAWRRSSKETARCVC
jgi:hypothetical protein